MTVRRVGEGIGLSRVECVQYRALLISGQQGGIELAAFGLLQCEQLVFMLEDTGLHRALYFSGQACFAVIALDGSLFEGGAIDQMIERVVAVVTQWDFVT
ncbi:hypothetical protein PS723_06686 [Pseudomonas fluorescens]|uniref:Uncharacterized protein n=1 Tax=Pseudomonas fluorescens TaxID=294 RepID=A0A5E7G0N0_PSEFL|nr:hypothetical protein PS723_06686 [Pseudomonas fluorescens]